MPVGDKDDAKKSSKRQSMSHTIRKSLKTEWPTFSAPSSRRNSVHLSRDMTRSKSPQPLQTPSSPTRESRAPSRKPSHGEKARSLAELLKPTTAGGEEMTRRTVPAEDEDKNWWWSAGWKRPHRFHARRMLRKIGGVASPSESSDHRLRSPFSLHLDSSDYPQSDDPSTGQSAVERKKKIDTVYKSALGLARQLGTSPINRIEAANFLSHSGWDADAALRRIQILLCTRDGILYDINPRIQMCGAVNSHATTCYIDSLLMALFGAQNSCDGLLYMRDLGSERANELQAMCRLMVNFIRAGELIDANLAEEMRSALIRCGWMCDVDGKPPYNRCTQQDANELYLFLMEKLQMPYLPMEVRMVHGADHDDADNRMVTQRVLELSFPDDGSDSTDGSVSSTARLPSTNPFASRTAEKPLLLQAMLETYFFDNRVEHLERILKSRLSGGEEKSTKVHTNAWSFLSMYPFYTPQNELGDITAAKLAAEYPEGAPLILPLLIKRYSVDSRGAVHRTRRRVIIPMVLDVTNIISTGDEGLRGFEDEKAGGSSAGGSESAARGKQPVATNRRQSTGGANSSLPPPYPSRIQYRLVLRSAICHKGTTTSSGHYISFCTRLRLARPGEVRKPLHTHLPKPGDGSHAAASTSGKAESDPVSDLLVPNSISKFHTLTISTLRERRGHTFSVGGGSSLGLASAGVLAGPRPRLPPRDAFRSRRRHSWPSFAVDTQSTDAFFRMLAHRNVRESREPSESGSGASTPTPSMYDINIHGTADDWANYAMTMNLDTSDLSRPSHDDKPAAAQLLALPDSQKQSAIPAGSHNAPEPGPRAGQIAESIAIPVPQPEECAAPSDGLPVPPREPPPYVQSEPGPGDGAAPTIGEFLRFDDMDISHSRMQYFSTSEGGRQCMDEISRDGYMLFYALQRVELPDYGGDTADESPSEREGQGREEGCSSPHAMEELSSALQKDEHDMSAKRAIDAIMRSSGAAAAQSSTGDPAGFVLADYRDDGQAFEDMAMRWQNIRLSELASPVGPLDASDRPSPFARTRSKAQLKERGQGADRHGDRRSRASKKPHSHHNSEQCTVM